MKKCGGSRRRWKTTRQSARWFHFPFSWQKATGHRWPSCLPGKISSASWNSPSTTGWRPALLTRTTRRRCSSCGWLNLDDSGAGFEIVDDLRSIVRQQGFDPVLVGGIYQLQGQLAQLVSASMLEGLGWLFGVFFVVALLITRSFRTAMAMIVSLSLCRFCMLGAAGFLKVPVDIISAPAANVCIGMAVDSMIHLVFAVRRYRRSEKDTWKVWVAARDEQWRAVAGSATIIATGFAISRCRIFRPLSGLGWW